MLRIKPSDRTDYPDLLSKGQLRKMGLMPAANQEPDALVVRQIYGNYHLFDKNDCVPFVRSLEEKEKRKSAEVKRKKLYTCPICKKYLGVKSGFDSSVSPGMCKSCFSGKRKEYFERAKGLCSVAGTSEDTYDFIVIDTETTGLSSLYDEILQLSIISHTGEVLFNEIFCPYFNITYPDASRVNGLFYEKVSGKPHIFDYIPRICEIISKTKVIVGYNVGFDTGFLEALGVELSDYQFIDVMPMFAEYYGEYDEERGVFRWKSLLFCANHFGYEFQAHDALEDCKATLYAYERLDSSPNDCEVS